MWQSLQRRSPSHKLIGALLIRRHARARATAKSSEKLTALRSPSGRPTEFDQIAGKTSRDDPILTTVNNLLLRSLPAAEKMRLLSISEKSRIAPASGAAPLAAADGLFYFVESGLVSVSVKIASNKFVDAWLIGSEGLVGASLLLTEDAEPSHRRVVQVEGAAWRVPAQAFKALLQELPELREALMRYLYGVLLQTSPVRRVQFSSFDSAADIAVPPRRSQCAWIGCRSVDARSSQPDAGDQARQRHGMISTLCSARAACIRQEAKSSSTMSNSLQASSCDCFRIIERQYRRRMQ